MFRAPLAFLIYLVLNEHYTWFYLLIVRGILMTLEKTIILGALKLFDNGSIIDSLNFEGSNQIELSYEALALFRRLE